MTRPVILLVEDNPDDVLLSKRALRKSNILNEVVVASNGEEALDFLFGAGDKPVGGRLPAVVLLDIMLPRLNGIEVLQRIRADTRTRLLPVVMLTSSKNDDDVVRSYEGGANSYVRKPIDFDEFVEATRQLGLYWLLLNVTPGQLEE